jgi:hypothetical protein
LPEPPIAIAPFPRKKTWRLPRAAVEKLRLASERRAYAAAEKFSFLIHLGQLPFRVPTEIRR